MEDLILKHEGVTYQFTDDDDGASLHWEWEGCSGTIFFRNTELSALSEWISKRRQPQKQP